MLYRLTISNGDRSKLVKWIHDQKQHGSFTVIDVGGSLWGWSSSVVDAICDINNPSQNERNIKFFKINLNSPDDWKQVDEYVRKNGKFDFSICSHTLEDISNPTYVCQKLGEISKGGYVAFPSKYVEFARFENQNYLYRGFIHHRWIFSLEGNRILAYPKIPYLEHDMSFDRIISKNIQADGDMSFYWHDTIPISIVNNDYLGPNIPSVIQYYQKLLYDDLDIYREKTQKLLNLYSNRQVSQNHYRYCMELKARGFEPKVIYDIGACVAEWTDTARLVWPNARFILFEAYDKLEEVLLKTGYDYYITVLSNEDDKVIKFYQNDDLITGNSYYREVGYHIPLYPKDKYVERLTSRLDTIVKRHGLPLPDLVKIDVQGAERDVIEGGITTLENATHLIVEMQHVEYNEGAPRVTETKPWIESLGWQCIAPLFSNNGPDGDYGFIQIKKM
jgi:FkbM family methyltransferase